MSDSSETPGKTPVQDDLSGRQLGDFTLLRRLGRGAMAAVYLAEQCPLKRRVAVKILKSELADSATYLKRFVREAQAAASLVHANIVQIYEVGHREGLHYIAQEYVQGQNLYEWITRRGPPDLPHALSIIRQVAAALAKAGEQGVAHRDIKPENIMLTPSGEVKVADFGLARLAREGEVPDLTQVGVTLGTPLYMSPEQVEGKPLDPRSDIYSFGVTCYHMLTGSPPFSAETALGVAVQHLRKEPKPLQNFRPDLPVELCRMIHKMLAKAPQHRYQSAGELLGELRRLHAEWSEEDWPEELAAWGATSAGRPTERRAQLTQQLGRLMKTVAVGQPRRPYRLLLLGLGVVAAFVLGALIAWFTTGRSSILADAKAPPPTIPKRETVRQQYLDARLSNNKEAWQAVIDYFPEKRQYTRIAKQQLSLIHLQEGDHDRAMAIFEELAASEDLQFRAFGLAGQCGVLALRQRYPESAEVLDQLQPIRGHLKDRQMGELLRYVMKKIRSKLRKKGRQEWEDWLRKEFGEAG